MARAKLRGLCGHCLGFFEVGDEIEFIEDHRYVHRRCYRQALVRPRALIPDDSLDHAEPCSVCGFWPRCSKCRRCDWHCDCPEHRR